MSGLCPGFPKTLWSTRSKMKSATSYHLRNAHTIVAPNERRTQDNQMKRKTEIEIEISETIAYNKGRERVEEFCSECKLTVEMVAPRVAAILASLTEREIVRLGETGKIQ